MQKSTIQKKTSSNKGGKWDFSCFYFLEGVRETYPCKMTKNPPFFSKPRLWQFRDSKWINPLLNHGFHWCFFDILVGGWAWMESHKIHVPNHQPVVFWYWGGRITRFSSNRCLIKIPKKIWNDWGVLVKLGNINHRTTVNSRTCKDDWPFLSGVQVSN